MFRIPPVAALHILGKRRVLALERRIGTAHDALSQILEAVGDVALELRWYLAWVREEARVHLGDVVEAVELMGHRGREDRLGEAFERVREVLVV